MNLSSWLLFFCLRAYIENLLNYDSEVKTSILQSHGFFLDTALFMEASKNNGGFMTRKRLFLDHSKTNVTNVVYNDGFTRLCFPVYTDLASR